MSEEKKLNENPETNSALELDDSIFQDDLSLDFGDAVSTADLEAKLVAVEDVEAAPVIEAKPAEKAAEPVAVSEPVAAPRVLTKQDIKAQAKIKKAQDAAEAAEALRIQKEEAKAAKEKAAEAKAAADKKADIKAKKSKEEKKKNGLWRRIKETFAELKKVSWPNVNTVVKQTLVVLGVTLFFLVALIIIDQVLGLGWQWFVNSLKG